MRACLGRAEFHAEEAACAGFESVDDASHYCSNFLLVSSDSSFP
jgi:hypothetical protein